MSATTTAADPIGLKDACKLVPGHPTYKTLRRWVKLGVASPGGRVRLAAFRVGGRWYTTRADLDAFRRETTAAHGGARPRPGGDERAARRRDLDAVLGT